ncbi:autotransporter-associated beta strand repeat-containing protein [Martelella sp. HB161492]|uniref:beta strand repeat-containing protein n=1 Tax=Martelella sp. HB161492 TaxID=2720726 RepID=UPI001592A645|nr:autotransporter-associated beta strand repeat-containing protein [Martelella sp. HB161492]
MIKRKRASQTLKGLFLCSSALSLLLPAQSFAATFDWLGTDTSWYNADNWSTSDTTTNTYPGYDDTANINDTSVYPSLATDGGVNVGTLVIGTTGTGSMTSVAALQTQSITIGQDTDSTGTLSISTSGGYFSNTGAIYVGDGGTGTLSITDDADGNSQGLVIGNASTGSGTVTLSGSGSSLNIYGSLSQVGLRVGNSGTGTLTVSDGAYLLTNDTTIGLFSTGNGTMTVTGSGTTWEGYGDLEIGRGGTGTLTISDGAAVISDNVSIGLFSDGTGTATVTGSGSTWTVYNDIVLGGNVAGTGTSGDGTLSVLDGAIMSATNATVGSAEGSTGTVNVDGAGSQWALRGTLSVGASGTGEVDISNGGAVTADSAVIGDSTTGDGSIQLTDSDSSLTTTNAITVANAGTGSVSVSDGATLSTNGAVIGASEGADGSVTVSGDGASWANSSTLVVGQSGTGSLTVENGATATNTTTTIGADATGDGSVTVTGSGSTWTVNGDLTVADSGTGSLSVEDGGTVTSTQTVIGSASGSTGSVSVSGASSTWTVTGGITVGASGTGSLTVADGATVTADSLTIASESGSTGSLNIGAADGETAAAAGTLDIDTVSFGSGTGTLVFNLTDSDYVFDTVISGTGTILVESGTTILTAENTNDGTTSIYDGATLQIGNGGTTGTLGGNVTIEDGGTLAFNRSDTTSFAGIISGDGTLVKDGAGTLSLTADSSFSGTTDVVSGTLLVDGSLAASTFSVGSGATLGGSGTVGDVAVATGGTFQSGDENGAISVDGDLTFSTGATYVAYIADGSDTATVSGDVSFDSTEVAVTFAPGGTLKQSYTLLEAGSISGDYSATVSNLPSHFKGTVTDDGSNLDFSLVYVGGDYSFSTLGQGVNTALVNAFNDGNSLSGALSAAMLLDGSDYENAMTTLGGELGVNATTTASYAMQGFLSRATNPSRMTNAWRPISEKSGDSSDALPTVAAGYWTTQTRAQPQWDWAYAGRGSVYRDFAPSHSGWFEYSHQASSISGDSQAGNSSADISGNVFEGGFMASLDAGSQIGVVIGGGNSRYDQNDQDGYANDTSFHAALVAMGQTEEGAYGTAALGVGVDGVDTNRTVSLNGVTDKLRGSYNATSVGGRAEGGFRIAADDFAVIPFAAASIAYTSAPGYHEKVSSGTGTSALAYGGSDILRGTVEAGIGFDTAAGRVPRSFSINGRASYLYRYGNASGATASFIALPGYGFTIASNAPTGSAVAANLGATVRISTQTDISFTAYGEWSPDYATLIASAKLRYIW